VETTGKPSSLFTKAFFQTTGLLSFLYFIHSLSISFQDEIHRVIQQIFNLKALKVQALRDYELMNKPYYD
jgi:hypothetical protein